MILRLPLVGALLAAAAGGCAPPLLPVQPTLYEIDVQLDTENHLLTGRTVMHLVRSPADTRSYQQAAVEVKLHADLTPERIEVEGASLVNHSAKPGTAEGKPARPRQPRQLPADQTGKPPTTHRLVLEKPGDEIRITMDYAGKLFQDIAAGEKEGEIHNFAVSAHVGPEGIFLEGDSCWYPTLAVAEHADPALSLADYTLTTAPVDGFELVASLESRPDPGDARLHWASAFPQSEMTLIGGPLRRWTRPHGQVTLHAVLDPEKEAVAEDILDLCADLLDRYQPLLGPFPYKEFTVLEAFFSSGFAFPGCTQIAGNRLSVFKPYRNHGYIDHEMLHSWWGCGVYVDPRRGNWCESVTSYCANYYGYVLDGDEEGARTARRNQSNFLSSIKPEEDKPLSTFGQDDGAGRGIAYSKGAAILHMLERRIGADKLFAALRRLTAEHMGGFITWEHIQAAVEAESGTDLAWFFKQWVARGGAPALELTGAEYLPGAEQLSVWLSQGGTNFVLDVPLRLYYGDLTVDTVAPMKASDERIFVPCEGAGLTAVELDPDYHLFRKLKPAEIMPTSKVTRQSQNLIVVVPDGDLSGGYQTVLNSYTEAITGTKEEPKDGHIRTVAAGHVTEADLAQADVLILGAAVRSPLVRNFLAKTASPVTWPETGFEIEGQAYTEPTQAVFFTVHHPSRPEGGVTVYYGNGEGALANARVLSYYPNSLLVFNTPADATGAMGAHGMTHTDVICRRDFEFHDRIEF